MTGEQAVTRKMCQVLERRYPGTTWVPVDQDQLAEPGPGEPIARLAPDPEACADV